MSLILKICNFIDISSKFLKFLEKKYVFTKIFNEILKSFKYLMNL